MSGFAVAAGTYVSHGAAPIPCGGPEGKTPLVRWRRLTPEKAQASLLQWAGLYGGENVGLVTELSAITVVDIDEPGDQVVDECLSRFGDTPYLCRSPRGGRHLYYRAHGEATRTKLDGRAIDIRGRGGFIVAPPSAHPRTGRPYEVIRGTVDDLDRLPRIKPGALPEPGNTCVRVETTRTAIAKYAERIGEGNRNDTLFRLAMREAHTCATLDELVARLRIWNEAKCSPPLEDLELLGIARSAWGYTVRGQNFSGKGRRVYMDVQEIGILARHPEAAVLLLKLREAHPDRPDGFALAPHAMAEQGTLPGWSAKRIRSARETLIKLGMIEVVKRGGGTLGVSLFRFPPAPPVSPIPGHFDPNGGKTRLRRTSRGGSRAA